MLTKNTRTHYILIKDWDRNQIKKISITEAQYNLYKDELSIKKYSDFFEITDIDTQEILFEWRASKIEWFEKIKRDPSLVDKVWVCTKWGRHSLIGAWENCDCK